MHMHSRPSNYYNISKSNAINLTKTKHTQSLHFAVLCWVFRRQHAIEGAVDTRDKPADLKCVCIFQCMMMSSTLLGCKWTDCLLDVWLFVQPILLLRRKARRGGIVALRKLCENLRIEHRKSCLHHPVRMWQLHRSARPAGSIHRPLCPDAVVRAQHAKKVCVTRSVRMVYLAQAGQLLLAAGISKDSSAR